jgi:dephospho-CoA kinase
MVIVGLTGGIGSGKSTVAKMFQNLGVPVYFADNEAKRLMRESAVVKKKLLLTFGPETFDQDVLNTSYLANIVFNDHAKLDQLNALVHPAVEADFKDWVSKQSGEIAMQENPLIFEKNIRDKYDKVVLIIAPSDKKIERLKLRDQATEKEIQARMNNQMKDEEKISLADFVILNDDLKETEKEVFRVYQELVSAR